MPLACLDDRAVVRVACPEAEAFLQNIVTADMTGLAAAGIAYGGLLTPQGKILFDFLIHDRPQGDDGGDVFLFDLPAGQAENFIKRLGFTACAPKSISRLPKTSRFSPPGRMAPMHRVKRQPTSGLIHGLPLSAGAGSLNPAASRRMPRAPTGTLIALH